MTSTILKVPTASIVVGENSRQHFEAIGGYLAGEGLIESVKEVGVRVPLIVRTPTEQDVDVSPDAYILVAGHRRFAAAVAANLPDVPAVIGEGDVSSSVDHAVENMVREQLTPYEEARAIAGLIRDGYSKDGAAKVLGWTPAKVTLRMKVLELPESVQLWYGLGPDGSPPIANVGGVDTLLDFPRPVLESVARKLGEDREAAHEWLRNPSWGLSRMAGGLDVYLYDVTSFNEQHFKPIKKKAVLDALDVLRAGLKSYEELRIPLGHNERERLLTVQAAFENGRTVYLLEKSEFKSVLEASILEAREEKVAARKAAAEQRALEVEERKAAGQTEAGKSSDEEVALRALQREVKQRAWPINERLGVDLMTDVELPKLTPEVARFFAWGLLGATSGHVTGPLGEVAKSGARLCVEALRITEERQTKKGDELPPKIDYAGDAECEAWVIKWIEGARADPLEILRRALIVYAMGHFAVQHAIAGPKRKFSPVPSSYDDHAVRALEKIVGKTIPKTAAGLREELKAAYVAAKSGVPSLL